MCFEYIDYVTHYWYFSTLQIAWICMPFERVRLWLTWQIRQTTALLQLKSYVSRKGFPPWVFHYGSSHSEFASQQLELVEQSFQRNRGYEWVAATPSDQCLSVYESWCLTTWLRNKRFCFNKCSKKTTSHLSKPIWLHNTELCLTGVSERRRRSEFRSSENDWRPA